MGKGSASVIAIVTAAIASSAAKLTPERAYADGPFNLGPLFKTSSSSSSSPTPQPSQQPQTETEGEKEESNKPRVRNDYPRTSASGFDPSALERGVKLIEKLEKNPNNKQVFEVIKKQEETKQKELVAKVAELDLLKHRHEIADDELQRARNQELVKLQEQSTLKLEQFRRATEEQIQAQRRKTEEEKALNERETLRVKVMAEAEGRARERKLTEEVDRRLQLERLEKEKEKLVAAINAVSAHLRDGLTVLLTDKNKLVVTVGGLTAVAAGIYTTREGARVIWGYVDRILGQPSLIRESSRGKYPWSGFFSRGMSTLSKASKGSGPNNGNGNGFGDVILNPSLQKRIIQLASATANTKSHQAPFRNMLFYGPPGTGKTMAARELAQKSGLDYALMTGGDVAPLGSQAVTKIHQLFDWSKKSRKGLLLFIDEADAFLCERNKTHMSEAQRSALNALLFRTGDQSKDIVLALATNRPGDLDSAIAGSTSLKLERQKLVGFHHYGVKPQKKIEIDGLSEDVLQEAAAKTEGFSGREIAKAYG
ncbi:hypothetical protein IFM89_026472 [Coptis chinensis]|uniref:AAA+ ATPase domain-containing protein n=1 Tax=Coptis chinensis TaxID=261450 RepID=A0A835IDW5_9MAGN|nr:hypothetical protein IFM89_026472 [Coptis chinensis]